MGFMIDDSHTPCGTAEAIYRFPDGDSTQDFEAVYTAYVKSFMRQDGSASKLSGLHLADTRNCRSWVEGYIDRQLYTVRDGLRVKFGKTVQEDFFEFFGTNDNITPNVLNRIMHILDEAFSWGSAHNVCSPEVQGAHLQLKAQMVSVVTKAVKELDSEKITALETPEKIAAFIAEENKRLKILQNWKALAEAGGYHDDDGVWHHPP